jgi:hypothetical protein
LTEWVVSNADTSGMFENASSFRDVYWYNESKEQIFVLTIPANESIICTQTDETSCHIPRECFIRDSNIDDICYAMDELPGDYLHSIESCRLVRFTDYVNFYIIENIPIGGVTFVW